MKQPSRTCRSRDTIFVHRASGAISGPDQNGHYLKMHYDRKRPPKKKMLFMEPLTKINRQNPFCRLIEWDLCQPLEYPAKWERQCFLQNCFDSCAPNSGGEKVNS